MLIDELSSAGSMPALEMALKFSAQRQKILASNIANFSTPDYRPLDASVEGFQSVLREAIAARRNANGGSAGGLPWSETSEMTKVGCGGGDSTDFQLHPGKPSGNVLFHDRNNRDLETTMQQMVENAQIHKLTTDLLRGRFALMGQAISERVG
ncbi:MAG: flagellar basal body rod protein FlgB [Phycisphaerales bacterium]